MIAAHDGLPVRDFRELLPPPESADQAVRAGRSDFYSGLAAEFEREGGAVSAPEIPEPALVAAE
jgi:hypothetical protein